MEAVWALIAPTLSAYDRIARRADLTVTVDIPGKPVPASRPRVTKSGHTYYAKTYRQWRRSAESRVSAARENAETLKGPLAVLTEVIYPMPKSGTKRRWPQGDNDNYEKAAWDVLSKAGVIEDDDQIVCNTTVKRYTEKHEQEGVCIHIYQLDRE